MAVQKRGLGGGSITKGCLYLLVASTAMSLVFLMGNDELKVEMARFGAASGQSLFNELKIWQVVTSPLLEVEFIALLFQAFMLWMFIPALERWWGTKRFFKFVAYTAIVGVVVGALAGLLIPSVPDSYPITGLDPVIYASIIAYGALFANQKVQFFGVVPLTGKQMTIGISVFMLAFVIIGQRWADGAANVSAMTCAWVLTNGKWTPKLWLLKRKQKKLRKHLKVVRGENEGGKKKNKKGPYLN